MPIPKKQNIICTNCGITGHPARTCAEPITSYGIINISLTEADNEISILKQQFSNGRRPNLKIMSYHYPDVRCYVTNNIRLSGYNDIYPLDTNSIPYHNTEDMQKFSYYKDRVKFMMVSRRFSLGLVEFIMGHYDVSDPKTLFHVFEQMYQEEYQLIRDSDYDDLLYLFLNRNNEPKELVINRAYEGKYSSEYCVAKKKFELLLNYKDGEYSLNLEFYLDGAKSKWSDVEWGFPKGRRGNPTEDNICCACREFEEETGSVKKDYCLLDKIEAVEEKLTGTNNINYKHIYYLAVDESNQENRISKKDYDIFEIGAISWFTIDEAILKIRPYHNEKKRVLMKVFLFIMNYLVHNITLI